MAEIIRIKKGLDIPLPGGATGAPRGIDVDLYGIVPDDFPGYAWKLQVAPGERVSAGTPLLKDKASGRICVVSPVGGTVREVRRGERRKIEVITIERDGDQTPVCSPDFSTPEKSIETLCASGLWAMMRQRPYDIVPDPEAEPRDIFITAFDSAPLAPTLVDTPDLQKDLEEGIKVLASLTKGKVYMGVKFGSGITSSVAEVYEFQGPHPAGNVGVQIAHIRPVNKGEVVWALDARTVARIGHLAAAKTPDFSTIVAETGECIENPGYVKTVIGASIAQLLKGNLKKDCTSRVISGNVLTGCRVSAEEGFLRYPYRQISTVPEGDDRDEFMGWASLDPGKYSVKRSFPAFLKGLAKPFRFDARIKGGHRAMILSGEYDKVFPMDIYPEYLIKAILAKNIDKMEQLGIYEVAPEDFALAEFVDTSKNELQKIVADGLAYLRKELS